MALVPDNIRSLVAYQAGGRIEEVARRYGLTRVVKLASNENPLGPSPAALEAARLALLEVNRYPDPLCYELRSALAERFGVRVDNVIVGNGSEGIMCSIMRTFLDANDEILSADGTFIGFRVLANASGRRVRWVPMREHRYDLEAMADLINDYTKIVYIANPDNPTGSYVTVDELDRFIARVPARVLVILDEAYFEFASGVADYPDSMHYRYDNVITLRTCSKAYGLAGLRVGYGFAHEELIGNLLKVKLPFEPATAAQKAALAALGDEAFVRSTIDIARRGVAFLRGALEKLRVPTLPSATNFVALRFPDAQSAQWIAETLLRRGVMVRHLAAFGWPSMIRVSVGLPEENELFVEQLADLLRARER
jgi:histidinol-phosphate aminotransferase